MNKSRMMRNSFILLFVVALLCPGVVSAKAKNVEIIMDEVVLSYNSQKPEIMNGALMSPYVPVLKQMNAKYDWNSKSQTLTIEKDKSKLRLTISSKKALFNGKVIALDAAPQLIKGNIYIPVKSVVLAFGADFEVSDYSTDMYVYVSFTDYGRMTRALVSDDYTKVKKLVDKGIDLKHVDKNGDNYLHIAAMFSSVEINQLLLDHGVPTNQFDKLDCTPLEQAIFNSKEDVVRLLAPYTDLTYVSPYTGYSYLDDAKQQADLVKSIGLTDKIDQAENIVAYLEEATGANLPGNSSANPAATGQAVTVNTSTGSNNKNSINITVEKALRGDQAWRMIAETAYYNDHPADGKEYIAVLVQVDLDQNSQNYTPKNADFNLTSEQGDRYFEPLLNVDPSPQFDIYLGNKKETSGWIVYTVPKNIAMNTLILGYKGNNSKNLAYFQLQETPETEKTVDLSQLQLPANISAKPDINELTTILKQNFSMLHTSQGDMSLDFTVRHNDITTFPYDYDIETNFDYLKYYDIAYGNSITEEQRALALQEMKDFQEKIGMTLTALYPNVKFTGSYYDSWYKYPYLKVGYDSFSLDVWTNYDEPWSVINSYQNATPSFFRWKKS